MFDVDGAIAFLPKSLTRRQADMLAEHERLHFCAWMHNRQYLPGEITEYHNKLQKWNEAVYSRVQSDKQE
jgi:hypothetical protein